MFTIKRLASGVLIGWAATFSSILIGLFMSPFLIHHLGVAGYGVWILIQSAVSYMYVMDLGLRTTVVRFSARAQARGDHEEVSRVVGAAIWVRVWTAALVMSIAYTLAAFLPHLFKIDAAYYTAARIALALAGTTLASTLVFSVFSAVLSGLGRFDVLGLLELAQITLTSLGLVPIMRAGHGIIAMAVWQFAVVLTLNIVTAILCFRIYPQLRFGFSKPEPELLRSLWSLGVYVLLYNGAGQLILYTDNIVVGVFVAAAAVSYYAVAAKMVEYLRQTSFAILKFFMPLASSFEANNQFDRLQQLNIRGTQAVMLVTLPIAVTLFFRGGTFFRLWISPDFSLKATPILQILVGSAAIMLANASASGLALALDRQRLLALVTAGEGIANLVLSIVLVRRFGVIGVAIGTVVPTIVTSLFFWPQHICGLIKMSPIRYMLQSWLRPALAFIPFAVGCYMAEKYWYPRNLIAFFLEMTLLVPIAVLGALLVFRRDIPTILAFARKKRQLEAAT
jgi:O-antigen/teichoic acid export membrane protein